VTRSERTKLLGHPGFTIWMTGLSASGKSTIACALEQALLHMGITAYRLDGDNVRFGLNKDLGFSETDRNENIRRIGEVARLFADSGTIVVTAFIAPYKKDRDVAREVHTKDGVDFIEVIKYIGIDLISGVYRCTYRGRGTERSKGFVQESKGGNYQRVYRDLSPV